MVALLDFAQVFACLPVLIGFIFMATCVKQISEILSKNPTYSKLDTESSTDAKYFLLWVIHVFFMLGQLTFTFGVFVISTIYFEFPGVVGMAPCITGVFCSILYMALKGEGIVKMPDLYGPPIPARILISISMIVLNSYVVMNYNDSEIIDSDKTNQLVILYGLAIGIPQLFALKHRKDMVRDAAYWKVLGSDSGVDGGQVLLGRY